MNISHTTYLSDGVAVCDEPARLGFDFVNSHAAVDTTHTTPCKDCYTLMFTHNQREFENEYHYGVQYLPPEKKENPIAPAQGCVIGIMLSFLIWVIAATIYYFLTYR